VGYFDRVVASVCNRPGRVRRLAKNLAFFNEQKQASGVFTGADDEPSWQAGEPAGKPKPRLGIKQPHVSALVRNVPDLSPSNASWISCPRGRMWRSMSDLRKAATAKFRLLLDSANTNTLAIYIFRIRIIIPMNLSSLAHNPL